jgi:glucose/arabinose dehydrogenase
MTSRHLGTSIAALSACLALATVFAPRNVVAASPELAQAAPAAPAPAAPPSWQQGRNKDQEGSTLAPHVPSLLGTPAKEIPIDKAKLPPGFKIEIWATGMPEARQLAIGPKGTVFVGNRLRDQVFAITSRNGKRDVISIAKGLASPNGVLVHKGALYVAERERILRYDDIENRLDNPPQPVVMVDGMPSQPGHFWKYLTLGPDGWIYFNDGAPGNIVMPTYFQATILRLNPATKVIETYAQGVRQSVGAAFHPVTKQLWFTDNGRDWLGEDSPSDELNVAARKGQHFGYPFCHQGDMLDPEFGKYRSCKEFTPPVAKLGPHAGALGMKFYTGKMFPEEYQNNIIIAEHGSWNKEQHIGYNLTRIVLGPKGEVVKHEPFLTGILSGKQDFWARPVDVLVMPDGALLVSDDWNGAIYRISYSKS